MSTLNKIKWVASILLVFFIVLITNLIDKNNFNKLRQSVTTIYQDRIVASDLIFDMSMIIHEKKVAVATSDSLFFGESNETKNLRIQDLIEQYEETKLTARERLIFNGLKDELATLKGLEESYVNAGFTESDQLMATIDDIVQRLHDLSKIQIKEGRRQMFISNKAMNTIELFTQGEIIFLVLMAILIQVIILYKPKQG